MNVKLMLSTCVSFVFLAGQLCAKPAPPAVDLNRRVFVDVNQAQPLDVIRRLSPVIGAYLAPEPGLSPDPISLRLWNVRARTALDAICEAAGCRWEVRGGTLRVLPGEPPPPVPPSAEFFAKVMQPLRGPQWKFVRVPLSAVAAALSNATSGEFVFDGADPSTRVTVDLSDQTPYRAAFLVMGALGWNERAVDWAGMSKPTGPFVMRSHRGVPGAPAAEARSPVRVVESDQPGLTVPRFASGTKPSYTPKAGAAGISGTVVLSCLITAEGDVEQIKVAKSVDRELDREATEAARDWRFVPAKKNGKAIPMHVNLEVTFGPGT